MEKSLKATETDFSTNCNTWMEKKKFQNKVEQNLVDFDIINSFHGNFNGVHL